ncbi:DNA replication protein [Malassezia japonica]|uniref:DNA replication complex GINS protein PSF3 n=1 Tax=Malassezia japonica TaxID=223818 RepID=A0AAF0F7A3_9BASI|nr:DNA replication protein [Malassezia japonica]WFD39607.1 DNA replication protein [Malassezia japonica]
MDPDYWSVEAILAEGQRLPCVFQVDVPGLGHLEESGEVDMHKNTRIELVYWMAHLLAVYDIVTIQQPRAYGARVRSALEASASSVQLRSLLPYWYALAVRLARLLASEDLQALLSKVRRLAHQTYIGRLARIYELAILLSPGGDGRVSGDASLSMEMQNFLQGLDESEALLLQAGQVSTRTMQEYLTGSD